MERDNVLLIDTHVHTRRYSPCGHGEPEEMVAAAIEFGLDAMVITEHHVHWGREELAELQRAFPEVKLFSGVEIATECSGDLLVIGARGRDWFAPRMPAEDVVTEAHARGGIVIAAHPFRPGYPSNGLDTLDLDAIEVYSKHMHRGAHERAMALAKQRGLRMVATSDAHTPDMVGLYALRLERPVFSEEELAQAIRTGAYVMEASPARLEALNEQRQPVWREAARLIGEGLDDADVVAAVKDIGYTETRLLRAGQRVGWPLVAAFEPAGSPRRG